jgi:hypothetical protein
MSGGHKPADDYCLILLDISTFVYILDHQQLKATD